MNVNVTKLQDVIKKATLNYVIPSVQIQIDGSRVRSKMRSQSNNVVVLLDMPNDELLTDVPDTVELNFDEPNTKVKPYLNLIDSVVVGAQITDEKITLKDGRHKTNLFFCMPSFVTVFTASEPRIPTFYEAELTAQIKGYFDKIIKVAGKFEKVYFSVKNKRFIVETTDRQNRFANGVSFELGTVDRADLDICFDFKNFYSLLRVMEDNITDFTMKFTWLDSQEAGMVLFEKADGSEKYYLLSRLDQQ